METRRSVKRKRTTTTKKRKTARKDHCELLLAAATGCVMALSFIFINNLSTGYQQQNVDNLKTIKAEENVDKARVIYESCLLYTSFVNKTRRKFMRILVISDSHGRNDDIEGVLKQVGDIDMMIHCGDVERGDSYIREIADCPVEMCIRDRNADIFDFELSKEDMQIMMSMDLRESTGRGYPEQYEY